MPPHDCLPTTPFRRHQRAFRGRIRRHEPCATRDAGRRGPHASRVAVPECHRCARSRVLTAQSQCRSSRLSRRLPRVLLVFAYVSPQHPPHHVLPTHPRCAGAALATTNYSTNQHAPAPTDRSARCFPLGRHPSPLQLQLQLQLPSLRSAQGLGHITAHLHPKPPPAPCPPRRYGGAFGSTKPRPRFRLVRGGPGGSEAGAAAVAP